VAAKSKKKITPVKNGVYDPSRHPSLIFALCVVGKDDTEINHLLQLSKNTLGIWRKKYPEVHKAFEDAREEGAVLEVKKALYKRALGMKVTTQQVRSKIGADGKLEPLNATKAEVELPPDAKAAQYILNNRRPREWKQRQEIALGPTGPAKPPNVHFYLPENGRPIVKDPEENQGDSKCQKQLKRVN